MKRHLTAALVIALLTGTMGMQTARANWRQETCRYQSTQAGHWTHREVRRTIRCGTAHFSVAGGYREIVCIGERESGLDWWKKNPTSSASGIMQVVSGTWSSWTSHFRAWMRRWNVRAHVFSARANVLVSIRAAHAWGLSPWSGGC